MAGLLLFVITLVAYAPVWTAGFIWDDDSYVTENRSLHDLDGLRRIWLEPGAVPQYYPLTFTSLWLEYHLWGLQPLGYHLVNLVLHAFNALLLWRILLRLGIPAAWMAAAVFALHPMHVESVAWITERKNVLSGLLALSALLLYLRALDAPGDRRMHWRTYLAVCVLFLGALLSKTVTCTLPAVLLLLAWWQHGGFDRRTLYRLAPLFALGILMAAMTVWVERRYVGAEGQEWTLSLVEHGLLAGRVFWFYPQSLLWPSNLTFIYPRWSIDAQAWWQYLLPLAAVVVLAGLYAARRWCGTGPLTAVLCYTGALVPALGFFNVYLMRFSFVADHFAYLPSMALIALGTAAAGAIIQRSGRASRVIGGVTSAVVLLLLALLTGRQCGAYRNLHTLWTDTISKNPECWMAHINFGILLAGEGSTQEAIMHFEQALRWNPDSADAHNNLGTALAMQGRRDEALPHLEQAVRVHPGDARAHSNLGNVLQAQGRLAEAGAQHAEALRLQPTNAGAHNNLGTVLLAQGQTAEAIAHFEAALRYQPDSPEARNNLNRALQAQGGSRRGGSAQ